ncbi:Ran GTPase binding protein Sbp1 [Coemansia sp. S17]|nr:Ran GTPase binding protein Sbp1 [Coemansia sp. S17]
MVLSPNVGSDRSWVWNVAADLVDDEVERQLLAIRFANSDNAGKFKEAFEDARDNNKKLAGSAAESKPEASDEDDNESGSDAEEEDEKTEEAEKKD